jgi:hypothetical protein
MEVGEFAVTILFFYSTMMRSRMEVAEFVVNILFCNLSMIRSRSWFEVV